jgi:Ca-activated chloride channel family protein
MFKKLSILVLTLTLITLSGCGWIGPQGPEGPEGPGTDINQPGQNTVQKVDDWQYSPAAQDRDYGRGGGMMKTASMPMALEAAPSGANLGFAVGGAKDVNNFRENIKSGFLPIPTDITYEGLFYNYFFDTGKKEECTKLFCPSYSTAVSKDPLSGKPEYYLSVGLNSGIKEADFQRKKLNLVVVMDISGSMGSPFDQYYYDRFGNKVESGEKEESGKTKIEIASQSITALLDHLKDDDRFGLVLFDDEAVVAKPLSKVGNTDMKKIKDHILELQERGGTYMEAGMADGTKMLQELSEADPDQYENRIVFITDAMPNIGDTSEEGLGGMLEKNAANHIYTTLIGVGVDFNTELVEGLTKIRGANYFSVHSAKEFKKVLDQDFDYMVTPLVFDLKLQLEAQGYEIEKVYGSQEADEATGEIMKINTLFPSKTEGGETKGGIVLLKLNKTGEGSEQVGSGKLTLKVSYEDRNGKKDGEEKVITFADRTPDYYDNSGIHKAILLTRYANLMKDWLIDTIRFHDRPEMPCPPIIIYETGIRCPEYRCFPPMPPRCEIRLGEWERQSVELTVDRDYRKIFRDFAVYFEKEMKDIGDATLQQELDILDKLK